MGQFQFLCAFRTAAIAAVFFVKGIETSWRGRKKNQRAYDVTFFQVKYIVFLQEKMRQIQQIK